MHIIFRLSDLRICDIFKFLSAFCRKRFSLANIFVFVWSSYWFEIRCDLPLKRTAQIKLFLLKYYTGFIAKHKSNYRRFGAKSARNSACLPIDLLDKFNPTSDNKIRWQSWDQVGQIGGMCWFVSSENILLIR